MLMKCHFLNNQKKKVFQNSYRQVDKVDFVGNQNNENIKNN